MNPTPHRLRLRPDVTACDTDDGMVLLNERTGRYWQLNGTAATILRALLNGASHQEITDHLIATTDVTPERAAADIDVLLDQLATTRLTVTPR